ncbi:hypothetical protein BV25DRAFT_1845138 [Artomyces pyxidatus]|uniref:Uncharacterized protein n=1 Tax=Artomyces pyxidatus TaxID=48021 RepID=A0ACB8TL71_9AGAM|nr:hypothetical protein BV25DRAFT_1845138 [Artomyces pyxidatus]
MSVAKLPAVRLPAILPGIDDETTEGDTVVVELPSSSKFSVAWPAESTPAAPPPPVSGDRPTSLSSSDADSGLSDSDTSVTRRNSKSDGKRRGAGPGRRQRMDDAEDSDLTPTSRLNLEQNPLDTVPPPLPRLSRAFSVPLPSQVGYLKNPRRMPSDDVVAPFSPPLEPLNGTSHLHELSLELADSVQMVIQTLLQLSPPQVFDPAKEQFSACALPIPTPSISAMFTTMKNLNYMSANMAAFSTPHSNTRTPEEEVTPQVPPAIRDFDIGETLQSVGDALSGIAAEAGVDLVLFHGDVGMKHIAVKGDESGISYTLSHIVRQVLGTARRGDSVEVGLFLVAPIQASPEDADVLSEADAEAVEAVLDATNPMNSTSSPDPNLPLRCTFQIKHVFSTADTPLSDSLEFNPSTSCSRAEPAMTSHIFRRLVDHIAATFTCEPAQASYSCKLSMTLERGSPAVVNPAIVLSDDDPILQSFADIRISGEPTLEDLAAFIDTLKGKKASLYASSKGRFAQHLTSYLTAWGLDVSHVSSDSDVERSPAQPDGDLPILQPTEHPPVVNEAIGGGSVLETLQEQDTAPPLPALAPVAPVTQAPSFILIDDDVSVLRERLRKLRSEQQYPLHLGARKRPALAQHHRPRSSPQVARAMGIAASNQTSNRNAGVIIHFTSLANFKLVKGILQSVFVSGGGAFSRLPEVIVIPKPAGPRRVLTALHTAATKPVVDPFFTPIATSPMSPGAFHSPYVHQSPGPKSPARPGGSPRSNSQSTMRSPKEYAVDGSGLAPPSPLGLSEGMDYFSDAAVKLGSSPSSGLVIQSPDGQPAGIFFHPRARRTGTLINMERDKGQFFGIPTGGKASHRRQSDSGSGSPKVVKSNNNSFRHSPNGAASARPSPKPPIVTLDSSPSPPVISGTDRDVDKKLESSTETAVNVISSRQSAVRPDPPVASSSAETMKPAVVASSSRKGSMDTLRKVSSPPSSPRMATAGASDSLSRKGSTRRSTMEPLATTTSALTKKPKSTEPNIVPPISVLIVDDNPINQTILSTFMKKKKLKFDVAKNGEEAVSKWKSGRFHLILMDIQMPVMDGISATKEIRRLEKLNASQGYPSTPSSEGQRTPSDVASSESRASYSPYRSSVIIVALTASSLQSDRVAALAAGCNDFLTKPVSLVWLNSKIIEWGSIKALQMWADIRPDVVKTITSDQNAQAQNIARRLHVPEGRASPSASPSRQSSQPLTPVSGGTPGSGPFSAPAPGPLGKLLYATATTGAPKDLKLPDAISMPAEPSSVIEAVSSAPSATADPVAGAVIAEPDPVVENHADDHAGDPSAPSVLGQGQGEPDINEAQNPFPSNTGASRTSPSVDSEDGFREPARLANGDAAQDAIQ